MNYLLIAAIVYIVFLLLSVTISSGRLVTPGVLFFGSLSVMLIVTVMLNHYFRLYIKRETFWILIFAAFSFFASEQLYRLSRNTLRAKHIALHIHNRKLGTTQTENKPIIVQRFVQDILLVIMFLCILIAIVNLLASYGGSDWNSIMHAYRDARIYTRGSAAWVFFLINQVLKLANAISYVCMYIVVYNKVACRTPFRKQKRLIILFLLYIPISIIGGGGRQETVEFFLFLFLLMILLSPVGPQKLKLGKLILRAALLLVVFVWGFTVAATLVGRSMKYRNPIFYVADYLCGGIINFNSTVGNKPIHDYWGQSSFAMLYAFINKFGLIPDKAVLSLHAFGWSGDYASSTTVTIFGRWYEDFGASGVFVMTALVAVFYSYLLYSKCDGKPVPNIFNLLYIRLSMSLVWAGYDDRVYSLISMSTITSIILICFFYWLLIGNGSKYKFVIRRS